MKKFLLFLILLIPIFNINALTLCDDTVIPDLPSGLESNYVIIRLSNGRIRVYSYADSTIKVDYNSSNFTFHIPKTTVLLSILSSDNTSWGTVSSSNTAITIGGSSTSAYILASSVDVYDSSDLSSILYNSGYNLNCTAPPVPVPQDFSLINTIASYINDFVTGLQNNNISIHITFVSLIIFNFLVFVVCYIISHLE